MKLQLLPSTFEVDGQASRCQHMTCFVVDDSVAFDAGSLAMAASPTQKRQVRDVVVTHAHLDHIAGLPLFIDDLFPSLETPVNIHATAEVIEVLERDIFNWSVYPRFSELNNKFGPVLRYKAFEPGVEFFVGHLRVTAVNVNHKVPSTGFIISDGETSFAMSGDTAEMDVFWNSVNAADRLSALLVECAFPNELEELANISHHLTPKRLAKELEKCEIRDCPIFVINMKPMYREAVINELMMLKIDRLSIFEVGKVYDWQAI